MNRKLLFITAFVPSRIGAGENHSRQVINKLSEYFEVDLIFFKYKNDEEYYCESESVNVIKVYRNSLLVKLVNSLLTPWLFPLFTVRFNWQRLMFIKKVIKKENYELAIFDFSQTFIFSRFIKSIPVILTSHDVIFQRYSRIYSGFFKPMIKFSERFVLRGGTAGIFCLSEKDRALFSSLYSSDAQVTSVFLSKEVIESWPSQTGDHFVFFANWSRTDNSAGLKWFINFVLPHMSDEKQFIIIGGGLPDQILELINDRKNVKYAGFVDNPYPVISNAKALISPLFTGAGVKVKVLESLACGTAVIGTEIAFEGISSVYSEFMIGSETASDFISNINDFKSDIDQKNYLKRLFLDTYSDNKLTEYIINLIPCQSES